MTQDEMERAIQFALNQQAQFWAGMQELKERQEQTSKDVDRVSNDVDRLSNGLDRLSNGLDTVVGLVGRLAQAEIELTNRMAALAEAGKETQERLDAFIVFVEKYIETHNGGRPGR